MSYIINKRDGTQITTVLEGTTDTTATSLTLVGQNYVGWGEIFQENLVHLMENFARSALPANALVGQLWFDTTAKQLKVLVAEDLWRPLSTSAAGTLPPASSNVGDFWYDTNTRQVKVWNSTSWQIVGPVYTATQGPTGANAISIADSLNTPRHVVSLESRGATFAIFNPYPEFLTLNNVPGFGNAIPRGFSFRSNISSDTLFHGTVENSMTLRGIAPDVFLRGDQDDFTTGNLNIINDGGVWLGSNSEARITVNPVTNNVVFALSTEATNFRLTGTSDGGEKVLLQSNVQSGMLTVYDDPVDSMGVSTKNYTDNNITQAEERQNTNLRNNVAAINNSIGILTTEINRVNNYAFNGITQLNADVALKAAIASPTFTGVPAAPTATAGTNTTQLATTAFVKTAVDTAIATTPPGIPTGGIILWSGSVGAIPTGWALCNGSNGTPDLRSRFVIGAGSAYSVNGTGGSADSVVVSHSHSMTDPGHSHTFKSPTGVALNGSYGGISVFAKGINPNNIADNINLATTGITVNSAGQSGVGANLPPYYALAYIMKTA
jgi:hypothetical protein